MNKDLREVRKKVMQKCIPSKGTANAKVLDKDCIWLVQGTAKGWTIGFTGRGGVRRGGWLELVRLDGSRIWFVKGLMQYTC